MKRTHTMDVWVRTSAHEVCIESDDDVCWQKPKTGWVRETPQQRWEKATATLTLSPPKRGKK